MNENESNSGEPLPSQTLEAVAKTIYRQAQEYGFSRNDFIRFVNILLDLGMEKSGVYTPPPTQEKESGSEKLKSQKITVRLYENADLPMLQKWVNDPKGAFFLSTRTDQTRWQTLEELVEDKDNIFGIVSLDDQPIGALAYLNVDKELRKAELRKLIGEPAARGRGYAKMATQYWIEYGISTLGLRKIYVNTLDTNLANIRLNEMLGFRVEGLFRQEIELEGEYRDILRMSLILP
jgi:RimJ/RimL family protein N-acetyltransferase